MEKEKQISFLRLIELWYDFKCRNGEDSSVYDYLEYQEKNGNTPLDLDPEEVTRYKELIYDNFEEGRIKPEVLFFLKDLFLAEERINRLRESIEKETYQCSNEEALRQQFKNMYGVDVGAYIMILGRLRSLNFESCILEKKR